MAFELDIVVVVEQWVGTSEKVWNDITTASQTMETSSSITQTLSGVVTDVITEKLTRFLLSGIYPLSQESKWNTYVYICTRKVIDTHNRAFSAHCSLHPCLSEKALLPGRL